VIRISYLTKRLESQLKAGVKETTKAAQSLNELGVLHAPLFKQQDRSEM
jgi:hypothetical protein